MPPSIWESLVISYLPRKCGYKTKDQIGLRIDTFLLGGLSPSATHSSVLSIRIRIFSVTVGYLPLSLDVLMLMKFLTVVNHHRWYSYGGGCVCYEKVNSPYSRDFVVSPVSRYILYSVTLPLPYSRHFVVSPVSRHFWKRLEGWKVKWMSVCRSQKLKAGLGRVIIMTRMIVSNYKSYQWLA